MGKSIDLTSKKFGRLTVIKIVSNIDRQHAWECKCDCGTIVQVRAYSLKIGETQSCGCFNLEKTIQRLIKHGLKKDLLYKLWESIIRRTTNIKQQNYKYYGQRGIKIWDNWRNDPKAFIEYCKTLPGWDDPNLTLDRINNNGNYEPGNLRFIDHIQQCNNRRCKISNTGEKYIHFSKRYQRYYVNKTINGSLKRFGSFKTLQEAINCKIKNGL